MRLIDVDKITDKEILECLGSTFASCAEDVMQLLDEQPTAFDVDKVVEQLEELKEEDVCVNTSCMLCKYNSECYPDNFQDQKVAIDRAIEIVKGGGTDAETKGKS